MSLTTRAIAVAALIALLGGLGWSTVHLYGALQEAQEGLKQARQQAQKTQVTLVYRERLRATSDRVDALARVSLEHALAPNRDWADTPVPKEVQDALCAHLSCAAVPDGLPDPAASNPNP